MASLEVYSETPHPFTPCIGEIYAQRNRIVAGNIRNSGDVEGVVAASTGYNQRLHVTVAGFDPKTPEAHAHWIWRPGGGPTEKVPTKPFKLAAPVTTKEIHEFFHGSIPVFLERMPVGLDKTLLGIAYEEHIEDPLFERSMIMAISAHVFFRDFLRAEEGKDLINAPLYKPLGIYLLSYTLTVNLEAAIEDFLRRMETDFLSHLSNKKSFVVLAAMTAYDMALAELARGYNRWLAGRGEVPEVPETAKVAWPLEKDLADAISRVAAQRSAIEDYLDKLIDE